MEKRKWYDKNIETSLIGFGVMRVKTVDGVIDEKKGFELIDYAYNHGVNYFDTAMPYTNGQNEKFLGKALKRYPRESLYIATKLSMGIVNTKEEMIACIDEQLSNLQTDYIDFYLLHALNRKRFDTFLEWGVFEHVENLKRLGKIRYIGFSFHDDYDAFKYILDSYDWDFCQIQLNYMDTKHQQGIKGYYDCVEKKVPVVIMEPLKGGKLSKFNNEITSLLKGQSESSISSWGLRWVGSLPGVKVLLSGMNELDQVIDNVNTFTDFKPLNGAEMNLIDGVARRVRSLTKVDCTGCNYCMPCPVGVNIPGNFSMLNEYAMYGSVDEFKWRYNNLTKEEAFADKCVSCKKCVKVCPQMINIPEKLKEVVATSKELIK